MEIKTHLDGIIEERDYWKAEAERLAAAYKSMVMEFHGFADRTYGILHSLGTR